jgi:hypothetical protein
MRSRTVMLPSKRLGNTHLFEGLKFDGKLHGMSDPSDLMKQRSRIVFNNQ